MNKQQLPIGILGKYISILHRLEQKYTREVMKEYDLGYTSYNFLIYLYQNEGISQRKLCKDLQIDESLATRSMKVMEKQGYVKRERSKSDARNYALYLTDEGKNFTLKLKNNLHNFWNSITSDLSENQKLEFLKELKTMCNSASNLFDTL